MNKTDYKEEYENLLADIITEKQNQIMSLQYEIQIQDAMAKIQYQNAAILTNNKLQHKKTCSSA